MRSAASFFFLLMSLGAFSQVRIDTVWNVHDARYKLPKNLPVNFSVYTTDSISGEIYFEKWEFYEALELDELSFFYKTESGHITGREPDIKDGEWKIYGPDGILNHRFYKNGHLTRITLPIVKNEITGKYDTLDIPIYNMIHVDFPDSNYRLIRDRVQARFDSSNVLEYYTFQGRVIISFIIEENGRTTNIKILKGLHPEFDEMCRDAVENCLFKCCTFNGKCVSTKAVIPIKIMLR